MQPVDQCRVRRARGDARRALGVRGEDRLRKNDLDGAMADLKAALAIVETPQDQTMAKLDAARGVSGVTPAWRSSVHANLAEILLRRDDKSGAVAAVDKAIKLNPGNGFAYSVRARIVGSDQHWAPALADFDKALQLGIDDARERAWTYYRRAIVRAVLKQPAERQLADYDSAIAADPSFTDVYDRRGGLYQELGRHEDALRDYDLLIARAPRYAAGYNSACWTRAAYLKREFEKARAQCDQALALKPEPNTYDSAGLVALQQGRWQDAWTLYDKAVQGDAKMASARFGRGIAARRLGRSDADADLAAAKAMEAGVAANYASYGQMP